MKRLILFTHKMAVWRRQFVWPLSHFAKINSLVMKGKELPQLSILLLLESIISRVELGLSSYYVATIYVVVSSLLVLLQNVSFWKSSI
jgi:hypothetical protein